MTMRILGAHSWSRAVLALAAFGFAGLEAHAELDDAQEAALVAACGYAPVPAGKPFTRKSGKDSQQVKEKWAWGQGNSIDSYAFSKSFANSKDFENPLCELYLMKRLNEMGGTPYVRGRCERVRDELLQQQQDLASGNGGDGSDAFGALDAFDNANDASDTGYDACGYDIEQNAFACAYLAHKQTLDSTADQKNAAKKLVAYCSRKGADMRSRMSASDYQSYANSGIDAYGGNFCGYRGGMAVIQDNHKWYDTLGNTLLGALKIGAPIASMTYIAHLQQKNASDAIAANRALGFPSAVGAGSFGAGMGGYGYGGYGMMGGYGGIGGGGMCPYYMGYGGSPCGYGNAYGNGGIAIGGMPGYGGMMGGTCGVPPYSMGGCGMGGGMYGGGGMFPGGFGGGIGGIGGGFPGPYGTLNGGNGWGGGMGGMFPGGYGYGGAGYGGMYPGGYGGFGGGIGGIGGGFPGPYGTLNGGNGWGGVGGIGGFGAGGMYGAGPYGASPYNASAMQAQSQMFASYASQMARQAQQATQYAKIYQSNLQDLQSVQQKAYQSYAAYSQATMGIGMPLSGAMYSGGGYGGMGGFSNGGMAYYPPYSSGYGLANGFAPATGTSLSFGGTASWTR